ncbi:hypothetical protein LTR97_005776 [Elasticomyces elasticus]|uniref:Peptidase C14 caspase domain-containing protein n=1 Tax=Elasticomyces elasticus TaxID=574655 RepID=A0AAN8A189_9PEZI|nr:hypothetical protein LTR97_005776 [Elasticomyces elasticus]
MPPPAQTQPTWQYSASQNVQYYLDSARNEYVFQDGRRIPISAIPVPHTLPSEPVSIRAAQAQVRQGPSTAPASTSSLRSATQSTRQEDGLFKSTTITTSTKQTSRPALNAVADDGGLRLPTFDQTITRQLHLRAMFNALVGHDNLDCGSDVRNLANVLSSTFGYTIQARQIPSRDSYRNLRDRVATFINDARSANELLIVFYSGHGSAGDPNDPKANRAGLEWSATERSNSPSLPWTPIQNELLMKATQDVLLILDCCYAGSALKSPATNSRKELLAACGWESETISGSTSYTANLIRHLRGMSGAFEACDLHSRLATSHATRKALWYTPLWTELGGNSRRHVVLTPLG